MTVKELAKIAGVSPAAISIVLNNKKGVSDATRKHILQIMEEYHYKIPSRTKKETSKNILFLKYKEHGMIVEENEGFIAAILDSIETECRSRGFHLTITVSDNCFAETVDSLDYSAYDGLIVLGTELKKNHYDCLEKIKKPFVVVDNEVRNYTCNSVSINNSETVYRAVAYLKSLGHREIGYLCSAVSIANFEERAQAFLESCACLNMDFRPEHRFRLTPTLVGAYQSMTQILSQGAELPTCLFADNDTIAIGAIKALAEYGFEVPSDLSVVGFDDIPFSGILTPPLTTMRVPKALIGTIAVKQVCLMMADSEYQNVKTRVGGQLVLRASTMPAPGNAGKE